MSRAAKPSRCPDCGRATLRGLDGDRCALDVVVEPDPVPGHRGELACVVLGRPTYELDMHGRLHRRTPAAVVHGPVRTALVAHDCGQPPPPPLPFTPTAPELDIPPF